MKVGASLLCMAAVLQSAISYIVPVEYNIKRVDLQGRVYDLDVNMATPKCRGA